ncbi:hypothetical protein Tco_0298718 [Tanacetum coccineum]
MVKTGLVEAIDSLVPLDEHLATFRVWGILETDIQEKDKDKAQIRQNRARERKELDETVKVKKSTEKSTPTKSKSTPRS